MFSTVWISSHLLLRGRRVGGLLAGLGVRVGLELRSVLARLLARARAELEPRMRPLHIEILPLLLDLTDADQKREEKDRIDKVVI